MFESLGKVWCGFIVRNWEGDFVAAKTFLLPCSILQACVAEAIGIRVEKL